MPTMRRDKVSTMLRHLLLFLLAGTRLCVYGASVRLPEIYPTESSSCEGQCDTSVTNSGSTQSKDLKLDPSDSEQVTHLTLNENANMGASNNLKLPEFHTGSLASSTEPPNTPTSFWNQKETSHSLIPPLVFVSPQASSPLVSWSRDGVTASVVPDTFIPEMGPSLMLREEGLESLWTEAARPDGDTEVPLSQDEATEATMSSEVLPLIFEPFEDATTEDAAAATLAQPSVVMATGEMPLSEADPNLLVTMKTDSHGLLRHSPASLPDWTSSWQTSGSELQEPISSSSLSVLQQPIGLDQVKGRYKGAAATMQKTKMSLSSNRPTTSSFLYAVTSVTMATHQLVHKTRSGLEELESEEEEEEDDEEEEENSEESVEDSEEDMTETHKTSATRSPHSLIPPPPVWVQQNQGLMRSWAELIREKAGYVSGMLAPVAIGITGALLIVGVLYSIRMIHRKHRNSFKHQRRKVRQPEQHLEPDTNRQDQTMLLADSSEDEF